MMSVKTQHIFPTGGGDAFMVNAGVIRYTEVRKDLERPAPRK